MILPVGRKSAAVPMPVLVPVRAVPVQCPYAGAVPVRVPVPYARARGARWAGRPKNRLARALAIGAGRPFGPHEQCV